MAKLLFWIGQNLLHFGLAKFMQEKLDAEYSAIIDCTNKPKTFFENQKIVDFKNIWFYHDQFKNLRNKPDLIYLRNFEKKYKINLSKLVFNERLFTDFNEFYKFSENEILSILENECKFFEKILETKPDFLLMFTPFFHHEALFFNLCKIQGIKILDIFQSRLSSRSVISLKEKLKKFNEFSTEQKFESFSDIREYVNKPSSSSKSFKTGFQTIEKSKNQLFNAGINFFFNSNYKLHKTHYSYFGRTKFKVLTNFVINSFRMKSRKKFIDTNFIFDVPNEKFIFYPLQLDSESSLLINAPFHVNQVEVIKNIRRSLPIDYKLLIKEHPNAIHRSWRKISTYKEIMELPGVKLVHPSADSESFLEKCSLLITINSTVALDALLWEKPSIIFADKSDDYLDWGYSIFPNIKKVLTFENLSGIINECLNETINLNDVTNSIKFLESMSFESSLEELIGKISHTFHYDDFLVDVDISEEGMKSFLSSNRDLFSSLVSAHLAEI